ncbi:MAG: DUF58 domain-containing protein [Candidatus Sumerlaeaceae bacterium]|nr:DUF58 domain-containing protein [Candidatus Sumerlaeaceae bacterium]
MTPSWISRAAHLLQFKPRSHSPWRVTQTTASYRYRLTGLGVSMLVLIVIIGYGAVTSGTNLVYYLFAMLIAGFLTHGIVSPRNLDKLEVERRLPRKFVAGSDLPITFVIKNKRRWWKAYNLLLEDRAKTKTGTEIVGRVVCSTLFPRETATLSYAAQSAPFRQRGIIEFREIVIRSLFPFGFIERAIFFPVPGELLVLPPIYRVATPIEALLAETGEISQPKRGQSGDLYGLREYVPGEPAKRIHWRTSARARRIMVTEFEREEHRKIFLALPTTMASSAMQPPGEAHRSFEFAVVLTASLAAHFITHNFDVGLVTNHGEIAPAGGEAQIDRIQRALALVELKSDDRSNSFAPSADKHDVVYIRYSSANDIPEGMRIVAQIDVREWQLTANVLLRGTGQ